MYKYIFWLMWYCYFYIYLHDVGQRHIPKSYSHVLWNIQIRYTYFLSQISRKFIMFIMPIVYIQIWIVLNGIVCHCWKKEEKKTQLVHVGLQWQLDKLLYRVAPKKWNSKFFQDFALINSVCFFLPCWIEHLYLIIITPRSSNLVENFLFYE